MNIGDKVRLIHSKEEGIITKFLKNDVIEVEIEAGFKLPVLKRELAVVSKSEEKAFKPVNSSVQEPTIEKRKSDVKADKGIFLAFLPTNEKNVSLHIINNTDWDLPFSLTTGADKTHRGIIGGFLKARSMQSSATDLALKDFDEWGSFTFQAFYHTLGFFNERPTFVKRLRLRANTFFNQKKMAPLLQKEAYLFQLDAEEVSGDISLILNVEELKAKMTEKKIGENSPKIFNKPESTVDLHIEELTQNSLTMSNAQMLDLQLRTFENKFESAIASGMDEIIFIHGVGNGVLRQEIQRKLAGHKNVAWFQDAQKEKFGYGATRIKIK
ncbi:Smr/MutS family protein [Emticicia sp. SJ17W-69]|uniref:Smr/MutS family protein n=1 Tax=Emticicia sp. SJ17W-69 TaxID=3421657 RepID=UPI003EBF12CA